MRRLFTVSVLALCITGFSQPVDASEEKLENAVPLSIGNEADWVTPDDYPLDALMNERQGITATELKVDRSGRVSGCRIVRSSGHSDLDDAACRALSERARFQPARNDRGVAITGFYLKRVRWQIPGVPRSASGNTGW